MLTSKIWLTMVLTLAVAASSSASARKPPRPGSFVKYAADTVEELVKQVSQEKVVGRRYSQFFKVSQEHVIQYFRENLQVIKLAKPVKVRMHFVSKTGAILCRNCWLSANHKVFANRSGEPVLDIGCGNPITETLPAIQSKVKGFTQVISAEAREEKPVTIPEGAHETPPETEPAEVFTVAVAQPSEEEVLLRLVEPQVSLTPIASEPLITESTQIVPFLQLARGLLPLLLIYNHSDHEQQPPIVPEPQTAFSLLAGTVAVALKMRYREAAKSK
ncbi:MAG: hypothetical protein QHI38_03940 [Armatimonadota bacterium]|nr:hypothetical protein [Armatimonadota bacterium]